MTDSGPRVARSIFREMLRGSSWAVLGRWSVRGIGLVSTMILARLLTPQDFGIVAMASLVVGFLRLLTELGPDAYVIRAREVTPELCDTAWTVQIIQGVVVGALLVASAPLAVLFFHEPRLTPVFYVLAGVAVIGSFQNIGMTLVRKELDFAKDFRFLVYQRVFKFAAVIPLAFVLRSYWAPVLAGIPVALMMVLLSFAMHRYRPRLRLHRAREIFVFGASMLLDNLGSYFNGKADVVLVGHVTTTAFMGGYNTAAELGTMATEEVATPVRRGLFPAYAKVAHDREMLNQAYLKSFGAIALLCLPLGVGLSTISRDAVRIVLGDQWFWVAPLLQWLAIYALLKGLIDSIIGRVLVVIGREWLGSALRWVRVAFLVPPIIVAAIIWGVDAVPIAATLSTAAVLPVVMYQVCKALRLRMTELLDYLWRPVAAAIVMAVVVGMVHPLIPGLLLRTLCEVFAGMATYVGCILLFWWVSGRPHGVENDISRVVIGRIRRSA